MFKLIRQLIGFVIFLCLFACAALVVLSFSSGLAQQALPELGLPEPSDIDISDIRAIPTPSFSDLQIEVADTLKPGEEILLPERVQIRPLLARVPVPQQLNQEGRVIGGNICLAIIMALLFGVTSTVLGNMLRDEEPRIRAWLKALGIERLVGWIGEIFRWSLGGAVKQGCLTLPLFILIVALYGVIFAFLEAGTSIFSQEGIWLAVMMAFTVGIVSFAGDIARRILGCLWRTRSRFNLYPINLLVAAGTVALSRLLPLTPGIVYGAPGGTEMELPADKREQREVILAFTTLAVLVVFGGMGWFVSGWVLSLLGTSFDQRAIDLVASLLTAAQNTGLMLFLVALETTFFELVPLAYSTGRAIFKWSKFVWVILFVPIAFLFNHALLNPQSGFLASFLVESNVRFLWFVLFVLVGVFFGVYPAYRASLLDPIEALSSE